MFKVNIADNSRALLESTNHQHIGRKNMQLLPSQLHETHTKHEYEELKCTSVLIECFFLQRLMILAKW